MPEDGSLFEMDSQGRMRNAKTNRLDVADAEDSKIWACPCRGGKNRGCSPRCNGHRIDLTRF